MGRHPFFCDPPVDDVTLDAKTSHDLVYRVSRSSVIAPFPQGKGELTTHPLVQEGNRLLINARVEDGGSLRVEVQDADGNVFPGLELDGSVPVSGDSVAHPVRWKDASLQEVYGRVVRLRVVLDRAHVYGFRLAP